MVVIQEKQNTFCGL